MTNMKNYMWGVKEVKSDCSPLLQFTHTKRCAGLAGVDVVMWGVHRRK